MINLINYPLAIWYVTDDKSISQITYGWDEFYNKIKDENLPLSCIENTSWLHEKEDLSFGFNLKDNIIIGRFEVIDGLKSIYYKLKILEDTFNLSNFRLTITSNKFKIFTPKEYPLENIELFFTANINFHDNIINGKQPLRSSQYYRKPFNFIEGKAEYKENDNSCDRLEGLSNLIQTNEIKDPLYNKGYINEVNFQNLPFDSYIFSLHDKFADKKVINKFGENTYKINNIIEWIELINNQVVEFWTNKRSDFIGTFVMFGKVLYDDEVKFVKEINSFNDLSFYDVSGIFKNKEVTYKIDGLDIVDIKIEKNIFENCIKFHFTKPTSNYEEESEHRLCIIPFYSNLNGDGPLNFQLEDNIINMKINNYNQVINLTNGFNFL